MGVHWGILAYSRLSLVLRQWIQDIEGANARGLCNTSSAKARISLPTGKMPVKGRREEGAKLLRRLLNLGSGGRKCISFYPRPSSLQAGTWEVRATVPRVLRVAVMA